MPDTLAKLAAATERLLGHMRPDIPAADAGLYRTDRGAPFAVFWRDDDIDQPTASLVLDGPCWICHDNQTERTLFCVKDLALIAAAHAAALVSFLGGRVDEPLQAA